jgi:Asp-tRNA(Asn)/Glu-tRNA(Gln) amidotransferase C subunit
MFENICKLSNIKLESDYLDEIWPSLEKTLSMFDVLDEVNVSEIICKDITILTESQLRKDKVTLNSPDNIDELKYYDPDTMSFITPKVIE